MRDFVIFAIAVVAALFGIPLAGLLVLKWIAFLVTYLGVPAL